MPVLKLTIDEWSLISKLAPQSITKKIQKGEYLTENDRDGNQLLVIEIPENMDSILITDDEAEDKNNIIDSDSITQITEKSMSVIHNMINKLEDLYHDRVKDKDNIIDELKKENQEMRNSINKMKDEILSLKLRLEKKNIPIILHGEIKKK